MAVKRPNSPTKAEKSARVRGGVYLYDATTLAEVRYLKTPAIVTSVAFAPDGALLASGLVDTTVRLWRIPDGTLVRTLEGHTNLVTSVAFSPDGTLLASGSMDDTVRLWQVASGQDRAHLKGTHLVCDKRGLLTGRHTAGLGLGG